MLQSKPFCPKILQTKTVSFDSYRDRTNPVTNYKTRHDVITVSQTILPNYKFFSMMSSNTKTGQSPVITVISPSDNHPDILYLMTVEGPPGGEEPDQDLPIDAIPNFDVVLILLFFLLLLFCMWQYSKANKESNDPYDHYHIISKVVQRSIPGD